MLEDVTRLKNLALTDPDVEELADILVDRVRALIQEDDEEDDWGAMAIDVATGTFHAEAEDIFEKDYGDASEDIAELEEIVRWAALKIAKPKILARLDTEIRDAHA